MFCDIFQQWALNVPQIPRFSSSFCFQVSNQTNQKHWYLHCFDKTACKKTRCFRAIFHTFSAHAPPFKKRLFFTLFLPPLIRTQEGVKSGQIAKLHLNSTFCLSQSLPQSCNTKNYRRLSGASKCSKLRCFMNVPCILLAKKGTPPPAKADCVSASGKTRPFAPTVRADFGSSQCYESESFPTRIGRKPQRLLGGRSHLRESRLQSVRWHTYHRKVTGKVVRRCGAPWSFFLGEFRDVAPAGFEAVVGEF